MVLRDLVDEGVALGTLPAHAASMSDRRARELRALLPSLLALCLAAATLCSAPAAAEGMDSPQASEETTGAAAPSGDWRFQAVPYLWLPQIKGDLSTRGLTAALDVDYDTIFDLLGNGELFAVMGHFEAQYRRKYSFFVDAVGIVAKPEGTVQGIRDPDRGRDVKLTSSCTFVEFGTAYRLIDDPPGVEGLPVKYDVLAGGRVMYFYQKLEVEGGRVNREADSTSVWVDPFVGFRFTLGLGDNLDFLFRSDVGGFGAGSRIAWNLIGGFEYALSWSPWGASTSLIAAYKALGFDHVSGTGNKRVETDLTYFGPAIGLSFYF